MGIGQRLCWSTQYWTTILSSVLRQPGSRPSCDGACDGIGRSFASFTSVAAVFERPCFLLVRVRWCVCGVSGGDEKVAKKGKVVLEMFIDEL